MGGGLIGILHVIEYSSFYSPNETTSLTFEFRLMASTFLRKKRNLVKVNISNVRHVSLTARGICIPYPLYFEKNKITGRRTFKRKKGQKFFNPLPPPPRNIGHFGTFFCLVERRRRRVRPVLLKQASVYAEPPSSVCVVPRNKSTSVFFSQLSLSLSPI